MENDLAVAIAEGYERWATDGDTSVFSWFSPDFLDHVSGRRGLEIFDVVWRWIEMSFADRRIEHHATMTDGDRIMVWYTQHGRHVGNGFPRMAGSTVTGAAVSWAQLHVFRVVDGKVTEHWAVRDDYGMIEQISQAAHRAPASE